MGRAPSRDAMRRHGGVRRWARRYGLEASVCRWDHELIEEELRAFLGNCRTWPTKAEFAAAGKDNLRAQMTQHPLRSAGWAARVGLDHPRARLAPGVPSA
jgi:hypothetical protein